MENLRISLERLQAHLVDPKLTPGRREQLQKAITRIQAQLNDPNFIGWRREYDSALRARDATRIATAEEALLKYEEHYSGT